MKKFFSLLLVTLLCCGALFAFVGCTPRATVLKVLSVADYIDEGDPQEGVNPLIKDFETWYYETTGERIIVKYSTVDTPEMMYHRIKNGKKDFDLICPSDYMIDKMRHEGLLLKYDFDTYLAEGMENYTENVSPFITDVMTQNLGADINDYFVGYMWGTMGILYNRSRLTAHGVTDVDSFVSSWSALWAQDSAGKDYPQLHGNIWMKDSIRDSFFCGSVYTNRNAAQPWKYTNDTSGKNVSAVLKSLTAQKQILKGYEVDEGKTDMMAGRTDMSFQWAGDAYYVIDEAAAVGVELEYSVPEEGSNMFFDGWAIPKYAENLKAAHMFVNYLCSDEITIRNMDYIGYTSCVATPAVLEYFSEEEEEETDVSYFFPGVEGASRARLSQILYPKKSILDKCEVMTFFSTVKDEGDTSAETRVKDMWDELKSTN